MSLTTRIILADYEESSAVDRQVMDNLGRTFDIDPLVLYRHFYHEAFQFEGSNKSVRHYHHMAILPLEKRAHGGSVRLGFGHQTFASAMLFSNGSKPKNAGRTTGKCGRECSLATDASFLIPKLVLIWNLSRLARYHGTRVQIRPDRLGHLKFLLIGSDQRAGDIFHIYVPGK